MRNLAPAVVLGLALALAPAVCDAQEIGAEEGDTIEVEARGKSDRVEVRRDDRPGVELSVEITPFHNAPGPTTGFTGEPLDAVVTVANRGKARAFAPQLAIAFSGAAVSADIQLKAGPAKPRQDADAAFFDIRCSVRRETLSCPLGYADRNEAGMAYLEPGEERGVYVEFTPWKPGAITLAAKATAKGRQESVARAEASRSTTIVGPTLGLALVGTTPEPYGYTEGSQLPLHEGDEITLRYAIRNSEEGGRARDIALDFFSRPGEVLSVTLASGESLPCSRPKPTATDVTECVLADLEPGSTREIDVLVRYRRRMILETSLRAGPFNLERAYEIGWDASPLVTTEFSPPPSATVSPGQEIVALFRISNRGRDTVDGAALNLSVQNFGATGFQVDKVKGCRSLEREAGTVNCALDSFSAAAVPEIAVILSPVPEGVEGNNLGLQWNLEVPGHRFPYPSSANEKGFVAYRIAPRLADLFVAEWAPEVYAEPGVPQVTQFQVGNKGTWPEDNVALKLRLNVLDEAGARDRGGRNLTRAAALLSDPDNPGDVRQVPCAVTANDAACALGTLAPRRSASIIFEWNSGDVVAGSYSYEAFVGEGLGERGRAALTRDNSLRAGAEIRATGETIADLRVFNSQTNKDAFEGNPQSFGLWVENDGTVAQENVGFKIVFDVTAKHGMPMGTQFFFLRDVYAVVPRLDDGERPVRRVSCAVVGDTASCALGRLRPEDLAQVFIKWHPSPVWIGTYSYTAFVSEGVGEAANRTLADNKATGGAAIVPLE